MYVMTYNSCGTSVVVCTDLFDKELHRLEEVGRVVTSGSIGDVMVSKLAQNARDVGSIPIFIPLMILVAMTMILYKLCTVLLLELPYVCLCKVTAFMYVIININKSTIAGGQV